jgi:hypothetical protein
MCGLVEFFPMCSIVGKIVGRFIASLSSAFTLHQKNKGENWFTVLLMT